MSDRTGLGDSLMLERIDKLIACGISSLINLPQIVVVGDQSSGKSSVLVGLIRKELPRDSGLCTRFATHIIFRRSNVENISASIIAGSDASDEHRNTLEAWKMSNIEQLDDKTFSQMMREVHSTMGLSIDGGIDDGKATFSNDIFRLEISGPDQEHLSVIDVPGIFKNTTAGVTTKADIDLVRNMVLGYMENPRSVMLAVIPANVDVATQEILELASDVDPEGDRTLGVLTKPDLVDKGAEHRVIDLIDGNTRKMKLGWHVVRDPGQKDLNETSLDRNALEMTFFRSNSPWKDIDKGKVGVENLRDRLKDVLSGLVRREFPKVKQEINKRLHTVQKSLGDLGPERSTAHSQCAYLTEIATKFQRLVMLTINTKYGADELFEKHEALRLTPAITARYDAFSGTMTAQGHTYTFMTTSAQDKSSEAVHADNTPTESDEESALATTRELEDVYDVVDLSELLHGPAEIDRAIDTGIEDWLQNVYKSSRGFELGTFDSSILATTMKKQSMKWQNISLGYISDCVMIVHRFIMTALDVICPDQVLKAELVAVLSDGLTQRYRKAVDQVQFLLDVERNGTPLTANDFFNTKLNKCRETRLHAAMSKLSYTTKTLQQAILLSEVVQVQPMSTTEHIVQDIHDILQSYYDLARNRFVDNILKQAMLHFLVQGPDTALDFFSPNFISTLTPDELEAVAGEAPRTKKLRAKMNKEITSLSEAKKILTWG